MTVASTAGGFSSLTLRVSAFLFLRWIPSTLLPSIISTSALVYLTSLYLLSQNPPAPQRKSPPRTLFDLLLGWPTANRRLTLISVVINVALVLMSADLMFTSMLFFPATDLMFMRIGHVSANTANILVRDPVTTVISANLSLNGGVSWLEGMSRETVLGGNETDFTGVLKLDNLQTDTRYDIHLSNGLKSSFNTAPLTGAPSRASGKTSFVHASCLLPRFPYSPFDHPLALRGLQFLNAVMARLRPEFMLFLGDFIYIDVPRRHGGKEDLEAYRREYRQVYASPDWKHGAHVPALEDQPEYALPWIHAIDDHEIANDWAGNITGAYKSAFETYKTYHLAANPPLPFQDQTAQGLQKKTYLWYEHGLAEFFILDTRRYRSPPNKDDPHDVSVSMLGGTQMLDLLSWISEPPVHENVRWKILVSSVPFTKNWRINADDTWYGYQAERQVILNAMWDVSKREEGRTRFVVLSGDRHEFAATAFPAEPANFEMSVQNETASVIQADDATTVYEFSCSPLNMFYLPVQTYMTDDSDDVCVKYIPDGNSKFGSVEIFPADTSGDGTSKTRSKLRYTLYVDGEERWGMDLETA